MRLFRLLIVLAVLLSPVAMTVGASAQAMGHQIASVEAAATPMSAGHCAEMDKQSKEHGAPSIDCMIACAGMLPQVGHVDVHILSPMPVQQSAIRAFRHGLEPEAATPPPRFS